MINKKFHIADKILERISTEENMWRGTDALAKELKVDQDFLVYWIDKIKSTHPEWIRVDRGYGDDQLRVILIVDPEHDEEYQMFIRSGGYSALEEQELDRKQRTEAKENQELEKLRLEIKSLRVQPWIIFINLLISIIAIIISIIALKK